MQSQTASTGCNRLRLGRSERGQSTVEFAIVLFGFLSLILALGALWHVLSDGAFVQHALQSASHHLSAVDVGAFGDVFGY